MSRALALPPDAQCRELVANLPVEFLVRNLDSGRLEFASDFFWQFAGASKTEDPASETPFADLIVAEDRGRYDEALADVERTGGFELDLRYQAPDGGSGWVEVVARRFEGASGPRIIMLLRDISARKQLEHQLGQSQKLEAIGQLAAGIAHEINTPCQYVMDNTEFLRTAFDDVLTLLDDVQQLAAGAASLRARLEESFEKNDVAYLREEIPAALEQAHSGLLQLKKIAASMKDFSHPGEDFEHVDLNRVLDSVCTVSRNAWKYVAELSLDFGEGLDSVECIPNSLNQVLVNIIVNAAHAIEAKVGDSGTKGTITVTSRCDGDHAEIRIADSGAGIPDDIRDKVFDPFFTTKDVGKGTGQGLAISYDIIVNHHGGSISIESTEGEGTTFVIRIPLRGDR